MIQAYEKTLDVAGEEKKQLFNIINAFEINTNIETAEKQSMEESVHKKLELLGKAIRELSSIYALISDNKNNLMDKTIQKLNKL